jgi:transforming growth factor-beta-induced protein
MIVGNKMKPITSSLLLIVCLLADSLQKPIIPLCSASKAVDIGNERKLRALHQNRQILTRDDERRSLQDIPPTVWDIVKRNGTGLSTLENLILAANATAMFTDSLFSLILAPLDSAVAAVPELQQYMPTMWSGHLSDLLAYHVSLIGTVLTTDFVSGQSVQMLNKEFVNVSITSSGDIKFHGPLNSATLIKSESDKFAENGIVHEIDSVIKPKWFGYNLLTLLSDTDEFSIFYELLLTAGLENTVLGTEIFTMFVPTNEAFASLPDGALESLKNPANIELLVKTILYHVVAGIHSSKVYIPKSMNSPEGMTKLATFQGNTIEIMHKDRVGSYVNRIPIVKADYFANNGIAHAISTVLTPPPDKGSPTAAPAVFSTFNPTAPLTISMSPSPSGSFDSSVAVPQTNAIPTPIQATIPVRVPVKTANGRPNGPVPKPVTLPPTKAPIGVPPSVVVQPTSPVVSGTVNVVVDDQSDLTLFSSAIKTANLERAFTQTNTGVGSFTVFAPTDKAVTTTLKASYWDKLLEPGWILHLQDLVLRHATIARAIRKKDFWDGLKITTVNMENITVSNPNNDIVTILLAKEQRSHLIEYDLPATNGVVHKVDSVFRPDFFYLNLVDLAGRNNIFSTFLQLVQSVPGMEDLLSSGDYTVLAPTDDAFSEWGQARIDFALAPSNVENTRMLLLYHVLPDVTSTLGFRDGPMVTAQGASLDVKIVNADTISFNGVNAIYVNALANNGIMHALDGVLVPPAGGTNQPSKAPIVTPISLPAIPTPPPGTSIVGLVGTETDTSDFKSIMTIARLDSALTTAVDMLLFAPTNTAIASFDQQLLTSWKQPEWTQHLRTLVLLHATGQIPPTELASGRTLFMFSGEEVKVTDGNKLSGEAFTGVGFDSTGYTASNGIVLKLDGVLKPAFAEKTVLDALSEIPDYSIFSGLLTASASSLPDSYTVLAPSNSAFQSLSSAAMSALESDSARRDSFVYSHVLPSVLTSPNFVETILQSIGGSDIVLTLDVQNTKIIVTFDSVVAEELDILGIDGVAHGIDSFLSMP